ncbi:MAG: SulP family inorganic anion transporter [Candidatus Aminicenantes bacterium]|nr:MAG: SulP family inorganic anion transporter [Candidatus Aminicenantes bacterium]
MEKFLPFLGWLKTYPKAWLRPDVLAGLTTAAVIIPKAMAFATIAGLPVETGLYAAFIPMIIYALMGTSKILSVSTTTTIAILVTGQLALVTAGGSPADRAAAAATLAVLVGGFLLLAGILRLGFIAYFISDPVLTGFKAGIGLVIIVDQLPKLLGFHIVKTGFFRDLFSIANHIPESVIPTLILGLITLVLIFGFEHFLPRFPAPLFAVVLGIGAAALLSLKQAGVELIGSISGGLPAFALPDLSMVGKLWPGALGIALMAFTESVAAGKAFVRHGDPHPDANQELRALGLANLAGGLFQAMPSGGGTSQTAVNSQAGARSQLAELVTVVMVVAVLLFLAPLVALMPQATLAAVVVATTMGLLSPKDFRAIARIRHMELWWALIAFAGVVILGTLPGILIAVAISLLMLLYQANHPPIYAMGRKPGTDIFRPLSSKHPDDETFPGLLIVRTEGRMTFASAPRIGGRLWELIHETSLQVLVFDFGAVPDIEYTALKMLTEFEEKLREGNITLWLAALNPEPLKVIERSSLGKTLGRERMFFNLQQAVETYKTQPK